jgi:threonylcarbamoyladenosine tRNA methylthiotransferase CDKAL1
MLRDMRRRYTAAEFDELVAALRLRVPGGLTIATDIIAGYPTESEQDVAQTIALLDRHRLPIVNINGMFVRPGTPAAKLAPLSSKEVKRRVNEISRLFHSYRSYDHLIGTEARVWVTELAHDGKHWAAHTKQYVQVLIEKSKITMPETGGRCCCCCTVRIESAGKFSVTGSPI